jgi:hypothetical protein
MTRKRNVVTGPVSSAKVFANARQACAFEQADSVAEQSADMAGSYPEG